LRCQNFRYRPLLITSFFHTPKRLKVLLIYQLAQAAYNPYIAKLSPQQQSVG